MTVTVACLTYRNPAWLSFWLEGLAWSRNRTPYRAMVVGCDAEPDVMATGRVDVDYRSADPAEYYLNRVYRAWNAAVEAAETDWVVLMNDDMYASDYWLDELVEAAHVRNTLPASLLVESGRIPSAMPEYVRPLGLTPDQFDREAWRLEAEKVRRPGAREAGRLYMPVCFERSTFLRLGGYPAGNPPGTTGDKDLFARYGQAGYTHVTCLGSVVHHIQEGAMRDR